MSRPLHPEQKPLHRIEHQETISPGLVKVMAGAVVSAPVWIGLGVFLGWLAWA